MSENSTFQIPKDVIEPMIQAHVPSMASAARGDKSKLVDAPVSRVLRPNSSPTPRNTVDQPPRRVSMKRRTFTIIAAGMAAAAILTGAYPFPASAQQVTKSVLFLNGFPPGGTSDLIGRILSEALRPLVGQSVIVENRTGASGFIAAEACARSAPDGHTLFLTTMAIMTINPVMPGQIMPINVDRDLTPISNVAGVYNLLVVHPNVPFKTVPELIDYAKKNPGKLTYASSGIGTSQHLSGELFKRLAGVDILHIPYRGGVPAIQDIVNDRVDMMFGNMPEFMGQIRGGRLKPIAFGGTKASPLLGDLPLISTWLSEYKVTNWFGVVGPAGLSAKWVTYWNDAINSVARQPKFKQMMTDNSMEIIAGTPDEFKATIASDRKRWGEVIQRGGIRAE
jgi:tripartite-type tricarboxylate transporter receptor subunit TctC